MGTCSCLPVDARRLLPWPPPLPGGWRSTRFMWAPCSDTLIPIPRQTSEHTKNRVMLIPCKPLGQGPGRLRGGLAGWLPGHPLLGAVGLVTRASAGQGSCERVQTGRPQRHCAVSAGLICDRPHSRALCQEATISLSVFSTLCYETQGVVWLGEPAR